MNAWKEVLSYAKRKTEKLKLKSATKPKRMLFGKII